MTNFLDTKLYTKVHIKINTEFKIPTEAVRMILPKLAFLNFHYDLISSSDINLISSYISVIKKNYPTIKPPPIIAKIKSDNILLVLEGMLFIFVIF